jgi:hypothetical protein
MFHDHGYRGNLGALVVFGPHHRVPIGHKPWPASQPGELSGWPAIFADGAPAPPVTSFVESKSFCGSIDDINTHDMTLAGDASFNGGIFLVAATVDRALMGSMAGERMNKSFGREVREREMS